MRQIPRALERTAVLCSIVLLAAACAGVARQAARAPVQPSAAGIDACVLLPPPVVAFDSIAVAATSSIDPAWAPHARSAGAAFLFAQLYEPLVQVDCQGVVRPALAESWTVDRTGMRWTLVLRDSARFWSGDRVTAHHVVASWQATAAMPSGALARAFVDHTTVLDEGALVVTLPRADSLALLADASLAVYRRRSGSPWPEGTGDYSVPELEAVAPGAAERAFAVGGGGRRIAVRSIAASEARDALDAGVDLVVTDDAAVVDYAAARADLAALPLPWDRTYVLLSPTRTAMAADSAAALRTLTRDAVRADARAAEAPFWWDDATACGVSATVREGRSTVRPARRIVYDRGDEIARALAERLVALTARTTAAGLAPDDFAAALAAGTELAYVVALPHAPPAPCGELHALLGAAPWLAQGDAAESELRHAILPLVDTRSHVIARRERVGLASERRGVVLLTRAAPRSAKGAP